MADATLLSVMSKQLEEQKLRTKASIHALKSMFDNLVQSQTKMSQSFIQPICDVESDPSTPVPPATSPKSPKPPEPPDMCRFEQGLTDEMEQQIMLEMSEKLEEQKQSTEALKSQIEKLIQSQAKLIQSQKNLETMMPRLFSQTSIPPRPPSQPPDPPDFDKSNLKFDGNLLSEWVTRCEQFFMKNNTPPEQKVRIVSLHMEGEAFRWHTDFIRNRFGIFPPWLDYIIAISAKFGDDDALPMHRAPFNPYYKNPYATPLLPATETIGIPFSKPDFTPTPYDEIQATRTKELTVLDEETYIRDHQLKYEQPQIFVKDCEDASMSDDEANYETNSVLGKETCPSSALCQRIPATQPQNNNMTQQEELIQDIETIREIGPVQEHESLGLTDSVLEVECVHSQEFSSQFQVPILFLEPSRRHHKESLVVVNDLSYDHGCVIGKTIGSIYGSELGQDNSYDEEEFIGLNLGKLLKNERLFSIIRLLGLNDMSCWTQLLRQKIFPKSWRFEFKTESSGEAWKFKYIQRLMLSVLLQMEQYKLLQGRTIKCKMRKKEEVLRRLKQFISIEVQFHMESNLDLMLLELVNFQANTRVLELIKDKASRKRKLYKTWWFKFKTSLERSILMDDKLSFIEESIEKDITKLGPQQGFKIEVWSGFDLEACIGVITYGWEFKKQFKSEKSPFQRTYAAQIKRCEEMARQICFFMDQTSKTRVLAKQMLVKEYDIDLDNVEAGEFFSYTLGSATAPQRGIESQQASEDLLESPWLQGEKCTGSTRQNIIGIIFKELCSAGSERENETIKKSFKGLSKVEKDHKIEATVLKFLGHTFGKITSGWIKDQKQGAIYEWSLFLQMLQTVKDRKNTNGVTIQVMVQRQWETLVMMLLTIAESLILLSDQFIFAENKGIEISISCCYGTSSVDMQFPTPFEIMSKQQHFIQLPNLPWESSHADADGILLKMEVLITPSTQNKAVTKALTQWKEHPPDQFYMALNGRNSIFHS